MGGLAGGSACNTLVDESGDDGVVIGLAGSGAWDTLVVEVDEWGGCACGSRGLQ